jgi:hypothetical protein
MPINLLVTGVLMTVSPAIVTPVTIKENVSLVTATVILDSYRVADVFQEQDTSRTTQSYVQRVQSLVRLVKTAIIATNARLKTTSIYSLTSVSPLVLQGTTPTLSHLHAHSVPTTATPAIAKKTVLLVTRLMIIEKLAPQKGVFL